MAPIKKAYSRPTTKKILKAHSNCNVTKNLDVLVSSAAPYASRRVADLRGLDLPRLPPLHADVRLNSITDLDYLLTLGRIVKEAAIDSKKAGERTITPISVKKAAVVCGPGYPVIVFF